MILPIAIFAQDARPALVNTAKIKKGEVNPLQKFVGSVYFNKTSNIASETSGKVVEIFFDEGDTISKGDKLVRVDSQILDAEIDALVASIGEAKSNINQATKDVKRYEKLLAKQSIPQKTYDDAYFNLLSLEENLKSLRANLRAKKIEKSKKVIYAPFNAEVLTRSTQVGEWVNAGSNIATIIEPSTIDVRFSIPFNYTTRITRGDAYGVVIGQKEYKAKVYALVRKGDTSTRTIPLKLRIQSQDRLFEGMQAEINLSSNYKDSALIVHRDAVIKRFGQNVIFLNANGVAQMMPVRIVGFIDTDVAIEAQGLQEGMSVVVKGNERIFPNQPIQSLNK